MPITTPQITIVTGPAYPEGGLTVRHKMIPSNGKLYGSFEIYSAGNYYKTYTNVLADPATKSVLSGGVLVTNDLDESLVTPKGGEISIMPPPGNETVSGLAVRQTSTKHYNGVSISNYDAISPSGYTPDTYQAQVGYTANSFIFFTKDNAGNKEIHYFRTDQTSTSRFDNVITPTNPPVTWDHDLYRFMSYGDGSHYVIVYAGSEGNYIAGFEPTNSINPIGIQFNYPSPSTWSHYPDAQFDGAKFYPVLHPVHYSTSGKVHCQTIYADGVARFEWNPDYSQFISTFQRHILLDFSGNVIPSNWGPLAWETYQQDPDTGDYYHFIYNKRLVGSVYEVDVMYSEITHGPVVGFGDLYTTIINAFQIPDITTTRTHWSGSLQGTSDGPSLLAEQKSPTGNPIDDYNYYIWIDWFPPNPLHPNVIIEPDLNVNVKIVVEKELDININPVLDVTLSDVTSRFYPYLNEKTGPSYPYFEIKVLNKLQPGHDGLYHGIFEEYEVGVKYNTFFNVLCNPATESVLYSGTQQLIPFLSPSSGQNLGGNISLNIPLYPPVLEQGEEIGGDGSIGGLAQRDGKLYRFTDLVFQEIALSSTSFEPNNFMGYLRQGPTNWYFWKYQDGTDMEIRFAREGHAGAIDYQFDNLPAAAGSDWDTDLMFFSNFSNDSDWLWVFAAGTKGHIAEILDPASGGNSHSWGNTIHNSSPNSFTKFSDSQFGGAKKYNFINSHYSPALGRQVVQILHASSIYTFKWYTNNWTTTTRTIQDIFNTLLPANWGPLAWETYEVNPYDGEMYHFLYNKRLVGSVYEVDVAYNRIGSNDWKYIENVFTLTDITTTLTHFSASPMNVFRGASLLVELKKPDGNPANNYFVYIWIWWFPPKVKEINVDLIINLLNDVLIQKIKQIDIQLNINKSIIITPNIEKRLNVDLIINNNINAFVLLESPFKKIYIDLKPKLNIDILIQEIKQIDIQLEIESNLDIELDFTRIISLSLEWVLEPDFGFVYINVPLVITPTIQVEINPVSLKTQINLFIDSSCNVVLEKIQISSFPLALPNHLFWNDGWNYNYIDVINFDRNILGLSDILPFSYFEQFTNIAQILADNMSLLDDVSNENPLFPAGYQTTTDIENLLQSLQLRVRTYVFSPSLEYDELGSIDVNNVYSIINDYTFFTPQEFYDLHKADTSFYEITKVDQNNLLLLNTGISISHSDNYHPFKKYSIWFCQIICEIEQPKIFLDTEMPDIWGLTTSFIHLGIEYQTKLNEIINYYRNRFGLRSVITPDIYEYKYYKDIAQLHTENIADTGIFAHDDLGFPAGQQLFQERLFDIMGAQSGTENILYTFPKFFYDSNNPSAYSEFNNIITDHTIIDYTDVVKAWWRSNEHRPNILFDFNSNFNIYSFLGLDVTFENLGSGYDSIKYIFTNTFVILEGKMTILPLEVNYEFNGALIELNNINYEFYAYTQINFEYYSKYSFLIDFDYLSNYTFFLDYEYQSYYDSAIEYNYDSIFSYNLLITNQFNSIYNIKDGVYYEFYSSFSYTINLSYESKYYSLNNVQYIFSSNYTESEIIKYNYLSHFNKSFLINTDFKSTFLNLIFINKSYDSFYSNLNLLDFEFNSTYLDLIGLNFDFSSIYFGLTELSFDFSSIYLGSAELSFDFSSIYFDSNFVLYNFPSNYNILFNIEYSLNLKYDSLNFINHQFLHSFDYTLILDYNFYSLYSIKNKINVGYLGKYDNLILFNYEYQSEYNNFNLIDYNFNSSYSNPIILNKEHVFYYDNTNLVKYNFKSIYFYNSIIQYIFYSYYNTNIRFIYDFNSTYDQVNKIIFAHSSGYNSANLIEFGFGSDYDSLQKIEYSINFNYTENSKLNYDFNSEYLKLKSINLSFDSIYDLKDDISFDYLSAYSIKLKINKEFISNYSEYLFVSKQQTMLYTVLSKIHGEYESYYITNNKINSEYLFQYKSLAIINFNFKGCFNHFLEIGYNFKSSYDNYYLLNKLFLFQYNNFNKIQYSFDSLYNQQPLIQYGFHAYYSAPNVINYDFASENNFSTLINFYFISSYDVADIIYFDYLTFFGNNQYVPFDYISSYGKMYIINKQYDLNYNVLEKIYFNFHSYSGVLGRVNKAFLSNYNHLVYVNYEYNSLYNLSLLGTINYGFQLQYDNFIQIKFDYTSYFTGFVKLNFNYLSNYDFFGKIGYNYISYFGNQPLLNFEHNVSYTLFDNINYSFNSLFSISSKIDYEYPCLYEENNIFQYEINSRYSTNPNIIFDYKSFYKNSIITNFDYYSIYSDTKLLNYNFLCFYSNNQELFYQYQSPYNADKLVFFDFQSLFDINKLIGFEYSCNYSINYLLNISFTLSYNIYPLINYSYKLVYFDVNLINFEYQSSFNDFYVIQKQFNSNYSNFNIIDFDFISSFDILGRINYSYLSVYLSSEIIDFKYKAHYTTTNILNHQYFSIYSFSGEFVYNFLSSYELNLIIQKDYNCTYSNLNPFNFSYISFYQNTQMIHFPHMSLYDLNEIIYFDFNSEYNLYINLFFGFESAYDLLPTNPISYKFLSPYILLEELTTILTTSLFLEKTDGQIIGLTELSLNFSEDNSYWYGTAKLPNISLYSLIEINDSVNITINSSFGNENFSLIVSARNKKRVNNNSIDLRISLVSPTINLDYPRSPLLDFNFNNAILAQDAIEQILEQPVNWQLINWNISANRIIFSKTSKLNAVKNIIKSVGGFLQSEKDGTITIRPYFSKNTHEYDLFPVDHVFYDHDSIFEMDEGYEFREGFNLFRIREGEALFGDVLEFELNEDSNIEGILYLYPSPWRENLTVTTTDSNINPILIFENIEEKLHTEKIEFVGGESTVKYPVFSIQSVNWLSDNLGGIVFQQNSKVLSTSQNINEGYGLAEIEYSTRYLKFSVSGIIDKTIQFITQEI